MREPDAQAPFRLPGDARQIVLVRHGAAVLAEAADGERSCMDADPGLAGLGHAQARAVAGRLASTAGLAPSGETMAGSRSSSASCSVLFSSGLHRADATAEHISRALGLSIRRVPSLREVGLGEYDGPAFERARMARTRASLTLSTRNGGTCFLVQKRWTISRHVCGPGSRRSSTELRPVNRRWSSPMAV